MVKDGCPTIAVPLILTGLSDAEVAGIDRVAVKCIDMVRNANCEGRLLDIN